MRTKALLVSLFLALAVTSCKNEGKKDEKSGSEPVQEAKAEVKNYFNIEVEASASKKDDFAVYFTEDNTDNYNSKQTIWRSIPGDSKTETMYFDFPEEIMPTNIRFDFGINKEQDFVVINKIKVSFFEASFEIKGSEFFNYFAQNPEFKTEVDAAAGTLKIVKNGSEYKTPFFYPNPGFLGKVKEITVGSPTAK